MRSLPDFETPPLVEVALSVQFEPIEGLSVAHIGRLWGEYRDRFPKAEDHPPLGQAFERFGAIQRRELGLQLLRGVPVPRVWFLNEDGTELLQIQADRFIHNWRKIGLEEARYPRYETIRRTFSDEFSLFSKFLLASDLQAIQPNQCEVTYVNAIELEDAGPEKALGFFADPYSDDFLPETEGSVLTFKHIIRDVEGHQGRLHIRADAEAGTQGSRQMRLTLTARGAPFDQSTEGILGFFDLGREWIVRGFCSITTESMHRAWGRRQ